MCAVFVSFVSAVKVKYVKLQRPCFQWSTNKLEHSNLFVFIAWACAFSDLMLYFVGTVFRAGEGCWFELHKTQAINHQFFHRSSLDYS